MTIWCAPRVSARQSCGLISCCGQKLSRVVILLELTCCAEEGIAAAQVRKESRYQDLLTQIHETKEWTARLFTLEVGARGLVGSGTFRAFRTLGLSSLQANGLCKRLSEVVARCSYAVYLGHASAAWPHNSDLVVSNKDVSAPKAPPRASNIVTLRKYGISKLFHFTDASNVDSIRKNGLMSASKLTAQAINATMNSDEVSRKMDAKAGLEQYVRLSFNNKNPMMFVCREKGRIANPVVLQVKLEVVSRSGVLFARAPSFQSPQTLSALMR